MASYELILIFDPKLGEEKIGQVAEKIEGRIKNEGGQVTATDKWGTRPLAYAFQDFKGSQVYYVLVRFEGETSLPNRIAAFCKVTENLLRYFVSREVKAPPVEEKAPEGGREEIPQVDEIPGEPISAQPQ